MALLAVSTAILESRVAKADRGLRRRLRHRQLASVNPPKEIISGAVLPPGAEVPPGFGDGGPAESSCLAVRGVEFAVGPWHSRIVAAIIGLVTVAVAVLVVWLGGFYRAPGGTTHAVVGLGRLRLVIGLCVVTCLMLAMLAHRASEGPVNDGMASGRDLRRFVSSRTIRRSTAITRPGLPAKRLPCGKAGPILVRPRAESAGPNTTMWCWPLLRPRPASRLGSGDGSSTLPALW